MEKEFLKLFESMKKAADVAACPKVSPNGAEVSRCVDALKKLGSFPINKHLLESTKVGQRLLPLIKKHPNEKIRSMASKLRQKWKTLYIRELTREKKNSSSTDQKAKCDQYKAIKVFKIRLPSGEVLVRVF
ncbi:Transcription elongation factor [Trema orientale]|uniref:Transcription elongation factor n=1 Tax=Trema orientale TaxID=63057 RepID=A0A2P5G265_TREOI|nr:Transcription elongation factor [Trema orientale]